MKNINSVDSLNSGTWCLLIFLHLMMSSINLEVTVQ